MAEIKNSKREKVIVTRKYDEQKHKIFVSTVIIKDGKKKLERFRVPVGAPTGTYLAESRLRSDLAILATGTGNFYIVGTTANYGNLVGYLTILFAIILLYMSVKRFYIIKKQNK